MKKALLIALIILAGFTSLGQKIRFTDSTNIWKYLYLSSGILPPITVVYYDHYLGDTTFHGISYKHLFHEAGSIPHVYIREDSVMKKVFAIAQTHDTDTSEQLLYDYTLNVGDTFRNRTDTYYVNSIDSVLIAARWYKVWHFYHHSVPAFPYNFDVIEGLGCIWEPCFPLSPIPGVLEGGYYLTCFTNQGIIPALSSTVGPYFNNTTSCDFLEVKPVFNNTHTAVVPNPIDNTSKLLLTHASSGALTIINSIGQVVARLTLNNTGEIIFGDKISVPGIYHYQLSDQQTGKSFSGTFIR